MFYKNPPADKIKPFILIDFNNILRDIFSQLINFSI